MKTMKWLLAACALSMAGVANAGVSATVTATTDYDFRGITLSELDPALQASLDYAHDSGAYAGIWGSNVNFGDCCEEKVEIDYYAGYGWGSEGGPAWVANAVWYSYPGADSDGTSLDYPEANLGVTYDWFTGKVWYSWDYNNTGDTGWYIDANGNIPLPEDFGLAVHAGYSAGNYWSGLDSEYYDWSVGVTRSLGHFNMALKYIDGSDYKDADCSRSAIECGGNPNFSTQSKVVFSVATTFPWGE